MGDELRSVVAAYEPRHTTLKHELVKHCNDPVGVNPTVNEDRWAFP